MIHAGVGLNDSPVGLAAYILEKFSTWTSSNYKKQPDGGLSKFNTDELLDNVMMYWVTGSMTTAMRLYSEYASNKYQALPHIKYVCITVRNKRILHHVFMCYKLIKIPIWSFSIILYTGPTSKFQRPVLFSRTRCR